MRPTRSALAAVLLALACSDRTAPQSSDGADAAEGVEAARGTAPDGAPNIVLVSLDTLRADHVSAYGYPRQTTPALDALADRGVLFEAAYSHSPKTAVSHMSLFTGLHPDAHGVGQLARSGSRRLPDAIPTLASLLRAHGYRTAGVAEGGNVRGELGFDQGMDLYERSDDAASGFARAAELAESLSAREPRRPFFLFVHTYEAHDPYVPPAPYDALFADPDYDGAIVSSLEELLAISGEKWRSQHRAYWGRVEKSDPVDVQHLRDLYDGAIRKADDALGAFAARLEALGLMDETALVVTSDHGEEFLEHGSFLHEQGFQEHLHVPLVMTFPGERGEATRGRRESVVVRLVDVAPTLLDMAGVPAPAGLDGVSLLPLLEGGSGPPAVVVSRWPQGGLTVLRSRSWKLIQVRRRGGASTHLFDLSRDPEERRNLASERPDMLAALEAELARVSAAAHAFRDGIAEGSAVRLDARAIEELRALGYLQDESAATGEGAAP